MRLDSAGIRSSQPVTTTYLFVYNVVSKEE